MDLLGGAGLRRSHCCSHASIDLCAGDVTSLGAFAPLRNMTSCITECVCLISPTVFRSKKRKCRGRLKAASMDMIEVAMVVLRGNLYSRWDHNEALFVVIFLLNVSEDQGLACVCFKLSLSPITLSLSGRRPRRAWCVLYQPSCSNCLPCTGENKPNLPRSA